MLSTYSVNELVKVLFNGLTYRTVKLSSEQLESFWLNVKKFSKDCISVNNSICGLLDFLILKITLKNRKQMVIDYFGLDRGISSKEIKRFLLLMEIHLITGMLLIEFVPLTLRSGTIGSFFSSLAVLESAVFWLEREILDMFGIIFVGHSNFRRILNDYGFLGYILRRDYMVTGYSEMRYFEEVGSGYYGMIMFNQAYRNYIRFTPWENVYS